MFFYGRLIKGMQTKQYTRPVYILFLMLPYGISLGFATVTLPYILSTKGFSVETIGGIVSIAVLANVWRFLWGPVADLTLTARKWYWLALICCVGTLLSLSLLPYNKQHVSLLTGIVFMSQIAATFVMLPISIFMAVRIEEHNKGRAGGWYQAGNLGGVGLGGGAGLWLFAHYGIIPAVIVLSILMVLAALPVLLIKDVERRSGQTVGQEIKLMGRDLVSMIKKPIVVFVIIMLFMPIGTGAAANLWSAIASDWHVGADMVSLVTGALSGITGALGCVAGGFITDRRGVWLGYLGAGVFCAVTTALMAALPYSLPVYITGVLVYNFGLGLLNAAFTAVILFAIGKKDASTKYALLSSIGNLPVSYMTAVDGWAHDKGGSKYMLMIEAVLGILFVMICIVVLKWMRSKNWLVRPQYEDVK